MYIDAISLPKQPIIERILLYFREESTIERQGRPIMTSVALMRATAESPG
jgi:hypothetical protein